MNVTTIGGYSPAPGDKFALVDAGTPVCTVVGKTWTLHVADVLRTTPGLTVVEILRQAAAPDSDPAKIRGMLVMGENPAMSDPDLDHARAALAKLAQEARRNLERGDGFGGIGAAAV